LIGTYVDDFPFVSQDPEEFDRVISTHKQWWNLKVKTEITKILGIKIHRTPNTTLMYDDNYFSEVAMELERYSRFHTKVTLPPNARYLPNTQYRASRELLELYQRLIGLTKLIPTNTVTFKGYTQQKHLLFQMVYQVVLLYKLTICHSHQV
jgi:hypothetical protein